MLPSRHLGVFSQMIWNEIGRVEIANIEYGSVVPTEKCNLRFGLAIVAAYRKKIERPA